MKNIETLNPATDPQAYARWGEQFIEERVNPFIVATAELIRAKPGSDLLEYVECSIKTTPERVILFADFRDGARWWVADDAPETFVMDRWKDRHILNEYAALKVQQFFGRKLGV